MPSLRRRPGLLLAGLLLLSVPATQAQELVHHSISVDGSLSQTVKLTDPWGDGGNQVFSETRPRDVETRLIKQSTEREAIEIELLLQGPWGWHHFSFLEMELLRGEAESRGLRTHRVPFDVDSDGQRELVLIERRVVTDAPLTSQGRPRPGARQLHVSHEVELRVLDRLDDSLVESRLIPDPDSPAFAELLKREHGGAINAALQLLAGDWLFHEERYAEARYRYQVAREWAERQLPGRIVKDLSSEYGLNDADPDRAETTWISAVKRHAALPPYFRRRY